jgi:hypothetical protein
MGNNRGEEMSNFNVEDIVIVYTGTPTFIDGSVGQIIDRDPNDNSYLVADLRHVGKANMDIGVIMKHYGKWVKPENMKKISLDKPKVFIPYYTIMLGFGIISGLVALGVYYGN